MRVDLRWCLLALMAAAGGCGASPEAPRPLRGVILFLGDGMGVAAVTAARIHRGALLGLERPVEGALVMDRAPRAALVRTWAKDRMVTDSAAAMTAIMCGVKARNGEVCLRRHEDGGLDTLATLLEIAESLGMSTGIVSTARLTHATPAACYAHELDRDDEESIALQLVPGPERPRLGDGLEVALGGGRDQFQPVEEGGRRRDGRDLVDAMRERGYAVVGDRDALREAVGGGAERVFGAFSGSHMEYEALREDRAPAEPSLREMTAAALAVLRRNPRGFFLMVEGGRIDHALHENHGYLAVREVLAMDEALEDALALEPSETLVLVTADHDHTMVIASDPAATEDVFSVAGEDALGRPYTALLFANGPSAASQPPEDLTADAVRDPAFRERAGVPLASETHGGMDVPLYAFGPREILDRIPGSLDNTAIFGILEEAIVTGRLDGRK